MSERSAADAGTPQPLGMPATDFTSHQLREARARAVSLAAKNERLVTALGTARERIAELGQQLDAVTHPRSRWDCSPAFPARGVPQVALAMPSMPPTQPSPARLP